MRKKIGYSGIVISNKKRTRPTEERFWEKVKKGSGEKCWEWQASLSPDGYGQFYFEDTMKRAHRISWELNRGKIPKGLYVLHKCDVRLCVNPEHLFLGTQKDNVVDAVKKGRFAIGEKNGRAKVNEKIVKIIRLRYKKMHSTQKELSKEFGISQVQVGCIVNNIYWKHI